MSALTNLIAREVLDSRGRPTVEVEAFSAGGGSASAIVPSGASTGAHEALELRDGDPKRHGGLGVRKAVANVTSRILPALRGMEISNQAEIDSKMTALDDTADKSSLGANAILGVSLAVARLAAVERRTPLYAYLHELTHGDEADRLANPSPIMPMPMVNLISGGLHAGRNLDFQDFLMIPIGAKTYSRALEMTCDVYRSLREVLRRRGEEASLVGDEGGYGPKLSGGEEQALGRVVEAIEAAGLSPGTTAGADVAIAIDVASTHFHDPATGRYRSATADEFIDRLVHLARRYPIVSIEDGLAEDDWAGWVSLSKRLGGEIQLIGDDLFVTQVARLRKGVEKGAANAVLIKVNQVGTLTETLDTLRFARSAGYRAIISARSGETEDDFLADLAVGTAAGQIKIGSVARSERLSKYNRLLRIEESVGSSLANPFAKG